MYQIFSLKPIKTTTFTVVVLLTIIVFTQIRAESHKSSLLDEDTDDLDFEGKIALVRDVPMNSRLNELVPHLHHHHQQQHHEGHLRRYKCLSCEPPDCADSALGTHVCQNAVQCWKSIVRDGKYGVMWWFCKYLVLFLISLQLTESNAFLVDVRPTMKKFPGFVTATIWDNKSRGGRLGDSSKLSVAKVITAITEHFPNWSRPWR